MENGPWSSMSMLSTTHYSDVIMSAMASQITGFLYVCSVVCSGADQGKHQSSASLAFVRGIHRWPVISQHKVPVTRKMFPFDDVIMGNCLDLLEYSIRTSKFSLTDITHVIVLFVVFIKWVYDNGKMGLFESMATIIDKSQTKLVVTCCNGAY